MEQISENVKTKKESVFASTLRILKRRKATIIQYSSLIFVIVLFGILTEGRLFSSYNIKTVIGQTTPLIIASVGVIFMFSNGSMDISSGAVSGICALSIAFILNFSNSLFLAFAASILLSTFLYLFSSVVSVKFGLISTIASLAVMFMARGAVTYVCSLMPSNIITLDNYELIRGFKNNPTLQIIITIIVVLVCWFFYSFTKIGKHTRAIGDNPVSAEQSGVKIDKTKIICSLIAGICVGIVAVFSLSRAGNVSKNIGSGMEMDIMVAMILGGMSLSGGSKSKFSAAIIGPITFRLLSNGMTMAGVATQNVSLIRGIIFLIIVYMTLRQSKTIKAIPR